MLEVQVSWMRSGRLYRGLQEVSGMRMLGSDECAGRGLCIACR